MSESSYFEANPTTKPTGSVTLDFTFKHNFIFFNSHNGFVSQVQLIIDHRWMVRCLRSVLGIGCHLNDADVDNLTFLGCWRSFVCCFKTLQGFGSLSCSLLVAIAFTTCNDFLELIWISSYHVTISTFFNSLKGCMGCLTIVIGSAAEHLCLNSCLSETLGNLLDKLDHLDGGLLIGAFLVQEFKHLSY